MYILLDDVEYFNEIFDKMVLNILILDGFEVVLICFIFGRRDFKLVFFYMFLLDNILISVYVVCIMVFSIIEMNLFWFRFGFLEIIGRRGIMFGVFFFCDCVNY